MDTAQGHGAEAEIAAPTRPKTVVVTGASSGIGRAIAGHMAHDGHRVLIAGRDGERLDACAREIKDAGGSCVPVVAELTSDDGVSTIVRSAVEAFGAIDVLVHAAGIFRFGTFASSAPEVLDEQYRVNVRAPYALTHAALPHLSDGSSVIFISSNLAQVGMYGAAAYCGTKGAVDALVRGIAIELAPHGIRVNAISPGIIRTPMTHRLEDDAALAADALARTPVGRFGEVEEIAAAVAYVASSGAAYMVGSTLVIDGGWNAH